MRTSPTTHPSPLIVIAHPDLRPLKASLQASYHRILMGLQVNGVDSNASNVCFLAPEAFEEEHCSEHG